MEAELIRIENTPSKEDRSRDSPQLGGSNYYDKRNVRKYLRGGVPGAKTSTSAIFTNLEYQDKKINILDDL